MRRLVLLVPAVLAAVSLPAHAAPTVSAEKGHSAHFTVVSNRDHYSLELLASTPRDGGAPRLRVRLTAEEGGAVRRLYGALTPDQLVTRGARTTLITSLGPLALRVVWDSQQYTVASSFGNESDPSEDAAGWTITGTGAGTQITLGGVRCGEASFAAVGDAVAYDTAGFGAPLSQGLGLPAKGLRCFGEWSSIPPLP